MRELWAAVERLDDVADPLAQTTMLLEGRALLERATRWMRAQLPAPARHRAAIDRFTDGAAGLAQALPAVLDDPDRESLRRSSAARLRTGWRPGAAAARTAAMVVAAGRARRGRDRRRDRPRRRDRHGDPLRRGRPLLAALAARPHRRAAPRQPLAGARARRAARRSGGPASRAEHRDPAGGARHTRRHSGHRATGSSSTPRAWSAHLTILTDVKASRTYDLTTLPVALREARNLASSV